uniref:Uncharacterized protein n=1 Tax=Panagrellus redivivus TaxID=6233 RepID=A0A7E4V6L8_PANRE
MEFDDNDSITESDFPVVIQKTYDSISTDDNSVEGQEERLQKSLDYIGTCNFINEVRVSGMKTENQSLPTDDKSDSIFSII